MVGFLRIDGAESLRKAISEGSGLYAQIIATRATLRVLPLILTERSRNLYPEPRDAFLLNCFRSAIVCYASIIGSSDDKIRSSVNAARRKQKNSILNSALKVAGRSKSKEDAFQLLLNIIELYGINNDLYDSIESDCKYFLNLKRGKKEFIEHINILYDGDFYNFLRGIWDRFRKSFVELDHFLHWIRWYEGISGIDLNYNPINVFGRDLTILIATQSDEWWGRHPEEVNNDISHWMAKNRLKLNLLIKYNDNNFYNTDEINDYKIFLDNKNVHEIKGVLSNINISGYSKNYNFMSISCPIGVEREQFQESVNALLKLTGGELAPDYCYTPDSIYDPIFNDAPYEEDWDDQEPWFTLEDVLGKIKTGVQHDNHRDDNVIIAIIDTGIDGSRLEFASPLKRIAGWAPPDYEPWQDDDGHGTMCAIIAAANNASGGRFRGIAPHAGLVSCRTPTFADGQIVLAYEKIIIPLAQEGKTIVVNHSFGFGGLFDPDNLKRYARFAQVIEMISTSGLRDKIHMVFSAGNYHRAVGGKPNACAPNSIYEFKRRADVLTVGACDMEQRMWDYSSRWLPLNDDAASYGAKPDVVAPTPKNGLIAYGSRNRVMPHGWGTSGAAPQAAGLLALLLSIRRDLPRDELYDIVRKTAGKLPGVGAGCQGFGMIDCDNAVNALLKR